MNNNIVTIPASAAGIRLSVWLAKNGYPVTADCGGKGTCGKCRVYAVDIYVLLLKLTYLRLF